LEEEAELAADGFRDGSFESMLTSDIFRESPRDWLPFCCDSLEIFRPKSAPIVSFFSSLSLSFSNSVSSSATTS
jgi:hypothetical protein